MLLRPEGFKYSYTQFKRLVGLEVRPNIWLPKSNSAEIVYNVLQPAVRFIRSQVVELKSNYTHTIGIKLSQPQLECRERLIKEALALYKEGSVRADNAAALSTKILQASLGAVYTSEENRVVIDLKNTHRIEMVVELISEAAGKVIVAIPYVSLIDIVAKELESKNILLSVVRGSVSPKDRNDIFNRFQDPLDPLRVIVAQPSCMAHGVTLTEADTIIWYGPVMKYEVFQQFNGRIIRPGQKRTQLIYLLQGSEIEKRFYSALRSNGAMQQTILGMFENGQF
jgi:SNF2 family DNA or RNA helicase